MRIIAAGDSYTYGHGLDGQINPPLSPHPDSWPYLLGNKTGIPVMNISYPGASNKLIWHVITNFPFKSGDVLVVFWSDPYRSAVIKYSDNQCREDLVSYNNNYVANQYIKSILPGYSYDDSSESRAYYEYLHSSYNSNIETFLFMEHAKTYVESHGATIINGGIPLIHVFDKLSSDTHDMCQDIGKTPNFEGDDFVPHWFKSDIFTTMTYEAINFPKCDDGHIGPEAHDNLADRVINHLKRLDILQ